MHPFILFWISLLTVVPPSLSTNVSLCRWFISGYKQDAVTCSSPDSMSVKSETGFMAETTDSITSISCQCGFKCTVLGSAPGFVLNLFVVTIFDATTYRVPQWVVHSVTKVCTLIMSLFFFQLCTNAPIILWAIPITWLIQSSFIELVIAKCKLWPKQLRPFQPKISTAAVTLLPLSVVIYANLFSGKLHDSSMLHRATEIFTPVWSYGKKYV